jgi:hypothetical protein
MRRPAGLAVLLAAGLGAVVLPHPAAAAGLTYEITSPATGTTMSGAEGTPLAVTVTCPLGTCLPGQDGRVHLTAIDPYGGDGCGSVPIPLALQGNQLTGSLDTARAYPAGCGPDQGRPAADGVWTLRLSGDATATRTVTLALLPAAPAAPVLRPIDGGLRVSFPAADEPDAVTGLVTVDPGTGAQRSGQVACAPATTTCTADVGAGPGPHTVTLATVRRTAPGGGTVVGPASPAASVTVPAADPSTGTAATTESAAAPAVTSAQPGSARAGPERGTLPTAAARSFATTAALPPGLGPVDLPSLPAAIPSPFVAPADEGVDGPFQQKLDYGVPAPQVASRTEPAHANPAGSLDTAPSPIRTATSIAGALLLALAAAHLRRWARLAQPRAAPEAAPARRRWRAPPGAGAAAGAETVADAASSG